MTKDPDYEVEQRTSSIKDFSKIGYPQVKKKEKQSNHA